jgi:hypothetical protein
VGRQNRREEWRGERREVARVVAVLVLVETPLSSDQSMFLGIASVLR